MGGAMDVALGGTISGSMSGAVGGSMDGAMDGAMEGPIICKIAQGKPQWMAHIGWLTKRGNGRPNGWRK